MWCCFYIVLSPCAILLNQHFFVLNLIFFHNLFVAANALHATNNFQIIPDFSLKDSLDQTVLGLALWTGKECCICTLLILDNIYSMIFICWSFVDHLFCNVHHVQRVSARNAHHSGSAAGLWGLYQWHYVQRSNPATHGHPKTRQ